MNDMVRRRDQVPDTNKRLGDEIDAYLTAYEERKYFSGAVLVARDGEVILSKGYGMANIEHNIPNTPNTKFRLASVTKAFTAAAVLLLQQRQLLEVGDPVSRYVPDFPNGDQITIHHLLTHTSGLDNPRSISETKLWKTADLVKTFSDKPPLFPPAEVY